MFEESDWDPGAELAGEEEAWGPHTQQQPPPANPHMQQEQVGAAGPEPGSEDPKVERPKPEPEGPKPDEPKPEEPKPDEPKPEGPQPEGPKLVSSTFCD